MNGTENGGVESTKGRGRVRGAAGVCAGPPKSISVRWWQISIVSEGEAISSCWQIQNL